MIHDEYLPGQFLPGTVYRIVRLIGRGSTGRVYEVEDSTVERRYALKTIADPDADVRALSERLMRESQILAKVADPRVVGVYTGGVLTDGHCFYVMELLGEPLRTSLRQTGRLDLEVVLPLGIQLGEALASMHSVGIVHRDVKPDNIFMSSGGHGPASAKLLLDLGVASAAEGKGPKTVSGYGTFGYASPEQLRGEPASPSMDIWSLGCVLFQAIAGRLPFEVSSDWRTYVDGVLGSTPAPRLSEACPDVPAELVALLARMLRKDSSRRLPRADMVSATLRRIGLRRSSRPPAGPVDLDPAVETLLKAMSPLRASPTEALTEGTPTRPLRAADVVGAPSEETPERPPHLAKGIDAPNEGNAARPLRIADLVDPSEGTPTRPLHIADIMAGADATPTRPLHITDILVARTEGTPTRPLHVADLSEGLTDRDQTLPKNFFVTAAAPGPRPAAPPTAAADMAKELTKDQTAPAKHEPEASAAPAPVETLTVGASAVQGPPEAAPPLGISAAPTEVEPPDETLVGTLFLSGGDAERPSDRDETVPTIPNAPAQPPAERALATAIPSFAGIDPPDETLVGTIFAPDAGAAQPRADETPTLHLVTDRREASAQPTRSAPATMTDAEESQTSRDETAPTIPTTPARPPAEPSRPRVTAVSDTSEGTVQRGARGPAGSANVGVPQQMHSSPLRTGVFHTTLSRQMPSQPAQAAPAGTAVPRQMPSQPVQAAPAGTAVPRQMPSQRVQTGPVHVAIPRQAPPQHTKTGPVQLGTPGAPRQPQQQQQRARAAPANLANAVAEARPARTQWVEVQPAQTRTARPPAGIRGDALSVKSALVLPPPAGPISEPQVQEPTPVRATRMTYILLFVSVLLTWMTVGWVFFRFAGSRKRSRLR